MAKMTLGPVMGLLIAALGGCAVSGSPDFDARFGDSVRAMRAQQLIDAGAPARNGQKPASADGRTVREASERHLESYKAPPQPQGITIGVGGGSSGGSN